VLYKGVEREKSRKKCKTIDKSSKHTASRLV